MSLVVARQHRNRRARPREAGDVLFAPSQGERAADRAARVELPSVAHAARRGSAEASSPSGIAGERLGDLAAEHAVLPGIEQLDADDGRAPRGGDAEHLVGAGLRGLRGGQSGHAQKLDSFRGLGHLAHEAAVTQVAGGELGAHAPEEARPAAGS